VALTIGPFSFSASWFGLALAAAYLLGFFLFWRWGRKDGFSSEGLLDLAVISSVAGLAGGKLLPLLLGGVAESFWVGAMGVGGLVFYLYTVAKGWSFLRLADWASVALSFGQALGWLGKGLAGSSLPALVSAAGFLLIGGGLGLLRFRGLPGLRFFSYLGLSGLLLSLSAGMVSAQLLSLGGGLGLAWIAIRGWFRLKRSRE